MLRILIFVHLDIQKQQQKRGVKKISCPTFFCSDKYHTNFNFELMKKIFGLIYKELLNFNPKNIIKI